MNDEPAKESGVKRFKVGRKESPETSDNMGNKKFKLSGGEGPEEKGKKGRLLSKLSKIRRSDKSGKKKDIKQQTEEKKTFSLKAQAVNEKKAFAVKPQTQPEKNADFKVKISEERDRKEDRGQVGFRVRVPEMKENTPEKERKKFFKHEASKVNKTALVQPEKKVKKEFSVKPKDVKPEEEIEIKKRQFSLKPKKPPREEGTAVKKDKKPELVFAVKEEKGQVKEVEPETSSKVFTPRKKGKKGKDKSKKKSKVKRKFPAFGRGAKKFGTASVDRVEGSRFGGFVSKHMFLGGLLIALASISIFFLMTIFRNSTTNTFIGKTCFVPQIFMIYLAIVAILYIAGLSVILIGIYRKFK